MALEWPQVRTTWTPASFGFGASQHYQLTRDRRRRRLVKRNWFSASLGGTRALWHLPAREVKTMRAFPKFNPMVFPPCSGLSFCVRFHLA